MADPVTIGAGAVAAVGMVSTIMGSITQAAGAKYTGEANAKMYEYQAGVARVNQQVAKQNADYERAVGEVKAQGSGLHTRYMVGQEKVVQAASGLDVTKGTSTMVRASQTAIGQQDQAIIRASAAKRAFGYEVEAFSKGAEAGALDTSAKTSRVAGDIGVASSLLGGAASVSDKWLQYRSTFGNSGSFESSQKNPSTWIPAPYE